MKNPALDQIKKTIVSTFMEKYGYCGVADSDKYAMLNSGADNENFVITIEDKSE